MTPDIDINGAITGAGVAVTSLVGALIYVRRALSKSKTGDAADSSAQSQFVRLKEEVAMQTEKAERLDDALNAARIAMTQDAKRVAYLESENAYITRERDRLMRDIRKLVRGLSEEQREILETDFAQLADVTERIEPKS